MRTLAWCVFGLLVLSATAIPKNLLYEYKLSKQLPKGDDVASAQISLKIPIMFYGVSYDTLYINSNGLLSFNTDIPMFFNIEFPLAYPILAPLYSNIDTTGHGEIYYFETADREYLARADITIWDAFPEAADFRTKSIFIVTWEEVGYHAGGTDKLNTFQVVICSSGHETYVEYLYADDSIQWIQSMGDQSGRPDARAQVGFIAHDGRYYTLPGSGTDQVIYLDRRSNMNLPGQWLFRVGNIEEEANIDLPKAHNSRSMDNFKPTTCATASTYCHIHAKCMDYEEGFCCHCKKGYYGNGKVCIKKEVPLRVNGKVHMKINNEEASNIDLQSYVVMQDNRAYTAMAKIPIAIGADIQSVQIIGATIAFLFAKPVGDAMNGFQLTGGVFNHTATITFPNTNQKVTIRQKYFGLDAFGQLKLETDITGEVPELPEDKTIAINEYKEQYTITSSGIIQSSSSHLFSYEHFGEEIEVPYQVEQNFIFAYCPAKQIQAGTTWKLSVGKNFIGYEAREQIVRFGMSNKIGPLGDIDPCEVGREKCGPHSSCVVEDDNYKCVCNPGYQQLYVNGEESCEDINECTYGIHDCDYNAQCFNEPGAFRCVCHPGFEGNGRICENAHSCDNVTCNLNSECIQRGNIAMCKCIAGFHGNGFACSPIQSQSCNIVNNCSPYAYCSIAQESNIYSCNCLPDYEGDGYECIPRPTEPPVTMPPTTPPTTEATPEPFPDDYRKEQCFLTTCWCPTGYQKYEHQSGPICIPVPRAVKKEEAQAGASLLNVPEVECFNSSLCFCPLGFQILEDTCIPNPIFNLRTKGLNSISYSCNKLHNCHQNAQCLFMKNGHYQCICESGYSGNGYECVEVEESCNENQDLCDIHAHCVYNEDFGMSVCRCNDGYQGDGLTCEITPICRNNYDCYTNEECKFSRLADSYDCLCKEGWSRDSQNQCVRMEGTCGGGRCVENAECLYDDAESLHYCACKSGYEGDGITKCTPKPISCEIVNNCGLHASCEYTPDLGYICKCDEGFVGDGIICYVEETCHVDPKLCDSNARCVTNSNRKYTCECNPGFYGNGSVCYERLKHEGNFLLVNQGIATLKLSYDPNKKDGRPIQIKYSQLAVGLEVDCFAGRIYWSDINLRAIRSATYNGSEKEDFITRNVGSPEGLAIDWVARNLYWTDSTKDTIEVVNVETKLRKVLINTDLVNPRGIAVHPQRGKIFWSDWNRADPKIEWANEDGSNRQVFLRHKNYVVLPNSLTVDYYSEQLCYADAGVRKIICVDIDSKEPHIMATNCSYPFGIAVTPEHIYWSDWISKKIERVEKHSLQRLSPLTVPLGGTGSKLYQLISVPDTCPNLTNLCYYYKDQCPANRICVPDGKNSRSCLCGEHLNETSSSTCTDSNEI